MTIGFILNGEDVVVRTEADIRLIDILRMNFGLTGAKKGCLAGHCGACSVIFNGQVSPACLIPAFKIRGSEIITIEGFSQTDEYQDIITGFALADIENCGYCRTGKILCMEALLEPQPIILRKGFQSEFQRDSRREGSPLDRKSGLSKEQILAGFSGIKCRCTSGEKLVEAVQIISDTRRRRLYGRTF
jgi:carbon-monoxide dehydrogenase small subunit